MKPVRFECAVCGTVREVSDTDYRQRMERSASGELFCSTRCSAKRRAKRAVTKRGVYRINIAEGGE